MRMLKNFSKRQAGYLLLEAALALGLAGGLVTYYAREQANQTVENLATAHGMQMAKIADAVNGYSIRHYFSIPHDASATFTPPPLTLKVNPDDSSPTAATVTLANPWRPTVQNLVDLELLPRNFTDQAMFGGTYRVILRKETSSSHITGHILTTAPVQYRGRPSAQLMGKALQVLGGNGGATGMADDGPAIFTTVGGSQTTPTDITAELNTIGAPIAAGIMGVRVGSDTIIMNWPYLKLNGESTMKGPIKMGGDVIRGSNVIRFGNNPLPSTCEVGDIVTSGGLLHECRALNTWTNIDSTITTIVDNKIADLEIITKDINATYSGTQVTCGGGDMAYQLEADAPDDGGGATIKMKCRKTAIKNTKQAINNSF